VTVVVLFQDYESDPVVLSFTKNGEDLGKCYEIPASELEGKALFPHVLSKNSEFTCNFGQRVSLVLCRNCFSVMPPGLGSNTYLDLNTNILCI